MSYTCSSRFFPEEWDLHQDTLERRKEGCVSYYRERIADLHEHSQDDRILGLAEYQKTYLKEVRNGLEPVDYENLYFHAQFTSLLRRQVELEKVVPLDSEYSFEFSKKRGIYFCVRLGYGGDEVWYVGKTGDFKSRWKAHHKLQALRAIKWVYVYCLPLEGYSDEELDYAERVYIYMLKPAFNGTSDPDKHLRG
jgi:hypothetical protein